RERVLALGVSPAWRGRLRFAEALVKELPGLTVTSAAQPRSAAGGGAPVRRIRLAEVVRLLWAQPPAFRAAAAVIVAALTLAWPVYWTQSRAWRGQMAASRSTWEHALASTRQQLDSERARRTVLEL